MTKFTGTVAPLNRENIDTDAIVPKQFLKITNKDGLGKYLFYDWRYIGEETENPKFILNETNYRNATILLTRKNFGCGSSREHAPWALADYGFRVIIAPLFADIFYNNCFKNGILPLTLPENEVQNIFEREMKNPEYKLTIDLEEQVLYDHEDLKIYFEIDDYRRNMLMKGLDEISTTFEQVSKIDAFEGKHQIFYKI